MRTESPKSAGPGSQNGDGALFRRVQQPTLVDVIEAQLREAILDGSLMSGQPVRESLVADQMGVSRAPVREALRRLEQSGLVVKPPNRSYEVTTFTDRDVYELATLRSALETLAAREAMRDAPALEQRLRDGVARIADAAKRGDERAALAADRAFHEALVESAGNRRLSLAYATLRNQIDLSLHARQRAAVSALDDHVPRHEALVAPVAAGDVDGLVNALERHILEGAGVIR